MTDYGLTPQGFMIKPLEQILADIEADQLSLIDPGIDTSAESVVGILNGIVAKPVRELWELGQAAYNARVPSGATFAQADALSAITGTFRRAATYSEVVLSLTIDPGHTIAAGAVASVTGDPTNRWVTLADAAYSISGPTSVQARSESPGAFVAPAGSIRVIATPVSGWTAVNNPEDAAVGTPVETDGDLMVRRQLELSQAGTATVPAVRADLMALQWVTLVTVNENTSDWPDALGRPPHSIEAVVQFASGLSSDMLAAARQSFAQQLWNSAGGGITLVGSHSALITDTNGQSRTIYWNEPVMVPVYVTATIYHDPATYAGDVAVQNAVVAFGAGLKMGDDVIRMRLIAAILQVTGVLDVNDVKIGDAAGTQWSQNFVVSPRSLASFDTGRVTVIAL